MKSGVVDVALGCGVESMSRVPLGAAMRGDFGRPITESYRAHYELTSQFEGAERIADKWGVTRADCDAFGLESQTRAQRAWAEGRFEREVVPIDAPDVDEEGKPTGTTHHVARDEGLRETSLEALAKLKPVARENGVHTAGSSSQITDGAAAVLLMTAAKAQGARAEAAGAHRRPVPRRRRPGADAHRPDRRDPPADGAHRPDASTTSTPSRSTRRSRRSCSRGSAR